MAGLTQKALDESWREGTQHGRVEGERTVLERQIRRRFGPLSPEGAERLNAASVDELEAWADNVLDAETLEDVFN